MLRWAQGSGPPRLMHASTASNTQPRCHRLRPHQVGMIVDRGHDFPEDIQKALDSFGKEMWLYRDDPSRGTTRAVNEYKGDFRG